MSRLRAVSAFVSLALATRALPAAAAEPAASASALPISLDFVACDSLDRSALEQLLAIEFQTLNVSAAAPLEQVRITCGASVARVLLVATGTINQVNLAATAPAAWPRLLALSVSEIVIEARARVTPAPPASAPAPPHPVAPKPAPFARAPRVHVFAGPTLRRAFRSATWLGGSQLGAELDATRTLSFAADARAEFGSTSTALADVHWVSARAALAALFGVRTRDWRLALGPGWCVGYVRFSPTLRVAQASAHRVSGAWDGPELVARASYDLSAHWFAAASVDAGLVTAPVSGIASDGRELLNSGGVWLSGAVALGVQF